MRVLIRGAGVAGLTLARELSRRGAKVIVVEKNKDLGGSASWLAGGMLAPWCERENAEEDVLTYGKTSLDWWSDAVPGHVVRHGTLVVAPPRDTAELGRFAARTTGHNWLDGHGIAALEPDLEGRFSKALFFPGEAHLDPRRALSCLKAKLVERGVRFIFDGEAASIAADFTADCTGMAARDPDLRGVRGEMLILHAPDVALSRPVRFLHPRIPVYVVPREGNHFMVGATMIESDDTGPISARSAMELLNAAYSLHPAFAEAKIVETGTGVRPAYSDNLPRIVRSGRTLSLNGLYRHGFLLSPHYAEEATNQILSFSKENDLEAHH
ncbi:glycine oxidase ThiO [Roseibium salinum]|uniref:Glycine oxidase ThiO n=1 Tax=Roseibium salinum TaxID=1604349 RepID=A0ABT3R1H8_9HYPH|nr:glycine oxidase ThiO [Roseibium sp. DSM 29163]MCX2723073.1 glycine oxidase ThiO [Roseibium sp. DSM 29163]